MWQRVKYWLKKLPRDIALTLYDDFDFEFISLARVAFFASIAAVIVSWIADQFFKYEYKNFASLVTWCIACGGWYVGKKFADKNRVYDKEP